MLNLPIAGKVFPEILIENLFEGLKNINVLAYICYITADGLLHSWKVGNFKHSRIHSRIVR